MELTEQQRAHLQAITTAVAERAIDLARGQGLNRPESIAAASFTGINQLYAFFATLEARPAPPVTPPPVAWPQGQAYLDTLLANAGGLELMDQPHYATLPNSYEVAAARGVQVSVPDINEIQIDIDSIEQQALFSHRREQLMHHFPHSAILNTPSPSGDLGKRHIRIWVDTPIHNWQRIAMMAAFNDDPRRVAMSVRRMLADDPTPIVLFETAAGMDAIADFRRTMPENLRLGTPAEYYDRQRPEDEVVF